MKKYLFLCLIATSCIQKSKTSPPSINASDFKDSFSFQHLTHFAIDSALLLELKEEKKLSKFLDPTTVFFDTLLQKSSYLLYSWQGVSSKNTIDFTVLTNTHLEPGLELHYIKLDSSNRIISDNIVARRVADTAHSIHAQSSKIISEDTILITRISTFFVDEISLEPLSGPTHLKLYKAVAATLTILPVFAEAPQPVRFRYKRK